MKKYVLAGYWSRNVSDKGALDLNKEFSDYLKSQGYPVTDCCNTIPLLLRNFANDAAAAIGGIKVSELYHNNGSVRIRLV